MARGLFIAARDDLYGASRALLAHLARLPRHGFEALALATPEAGSLSAAARALGVEVVIAPAVASSRSVVARISAAWRLRALARFAAARRFEVIVAATLSAGPPAIAVARMIGSKSVVHLRSTYAARGKGSAFSRYRAGEADGVIAVSAAVLAEAPALARSAIVFDGIEPARLRSRAEARRVLGLGEHERVAGLVGTVSPRKGSAFAARIVSRAGGVVLAVLGEGEDDFGSKACVRRFGFRSDAAELYAAFDVLLHPARDEAFGLAPLEAMAAGVPVIASRVGGLPEALGDAAVLVEPFDEDAWCAALARVLADPQALVSKGLARAAAMSADESARRVAEVYRSVIAEGAR
jgi:glycosyltransferase involved in cell wall biosynthesis